jgi:hypothetical protein
MAMASSNLELLTNAAKLPEPLLGELVFVGGCATELLITDKAAAECVQPWMWMRLWRSRHTLDTKHFRKARGGQKLILQLIRAG